jgi:cytosine/creatinine deaminase
MDLILQNAKLLKKKGLHQIGVNRGSIVAIDTAISENSALRVIDLEGSMVVPYFVDSHFHLDSVLSVGKPRFNQSGTLFEGIEIWGDLKATISRQEIIDRATRYCRWAIAQGIGAIRSHVDVSETTLTTVEALLEVREAMRPYLTIQLVAFPQDGYLRVPGQIERLKRALDMGVDIVGGIPHGERTMHEGAESIRLLCELAAERGLPVDMHCDESDDPFSRHIEQLTYHTQRLGLNGRVVGSHLTSMHSMDSYYVSKLLSLMAEAEIHAVANPLINITLQGRHDTYPKRRGLTRVPEMLASGINVSLGHDCVMDPWYALGRADMLEVSSMAWHLAQMTRPEHSEVMLDLITVNGAKTLGLKDYGIEVGNPASFVVLQAQSATDALRLKPNRLFVVRDGVIISETPATHSTLNLGGQSHAVDFSSLNV